MRQPAFPNSRDLASPSAEYERYRSEYAVEQQGMLGTVIEVASSYSPLFHILSSLLAQLDVLLAFAEVSATATIPYTRPDLLDVTRDNCTRTP